MKNYLGFNYEQYIGQTLVIPPPGSIYSKELKGFYKKLPKTLVNKNNIYSPSRKVESILEGTPYKDLSTRHFFVEGISKNEIGIFLKLRDIQNDEILYFEYNNTHEHTFPFITLGYFEKQKQIYSGKKYYARTPKINHFSPYEYKTTTTSGDVFDCEIGSVWKIIDVQAVDSKLSSRIQFIMTDGHKEIYVIKDLIKEYDLVDKEKYKVIADRYSDDILNKVLRHYYYKGWDSYLVRMSQGSPDKTRSYNSGNSKIDYWIYESGLQLTFTDGKLTSILSTN